MKTKFAFTLSGERTVYAIQTGARAAEAPMTAIAGEPMVYALIDSREATLHGYVVPDNFDDYSVSDDLDPEFFLAVADEREAA